jgi:opacity protein-like surface antigen/outer membrane protease
MAFYRTTVACACAVAAYASSQALAGGDLPIRYDWSGFYLGAHLGGGLQLTDVHDPFGASIYGDVVRSPGPIIGGQAGYNWQSGATVLGVEAELSWTDAFGTNTCFAYSGFFISADCRVQTNTLGTVAGRAGWLIGADGGTLLYGKAGSAWISGDLRASAGGGSGYPATGSNETLWGWMLGAGIERAVSSRWSWKAEYDFVSFEKGGLSTAPSGYQPVPSGDPNALVGVPSVATRYSPEMHLFKIGVNYHLADTPSADAWESQPSLSPLADTSVEVGLRYVYGWGRFQKDLGITGLGTGSAASRLTYSDNDTNGAEVFARFDTSFGLMAKGFVGFGNGQGKLNDEDWQLPFATFVPYSNTYSKVDDEIRYGIIDVGYDLWNSSGVRAAPFVGYSIFKQKMTGYGCVQIANPHSDCTPAPIPFSTAAIEEDDRWQALRLGVAVDFEIVPGITVSADAAYLPYVRFDGVDDHILRSLVSPEWANGTGTQLELIVSYALTDTFKLGVGGRYWAMWTADGMVNFGGQELVPMRYSVEQAALLVQGSYTFSRLGD